MKGLQHVNPGGWTYSAGWSDLIKDQTIINEQNTKLRAQADIEKRLAALEGKDAGKQVSSLNNRDENLTIAGMIADPRYTGGGLRSEEHTSELPSLMRLSYAVFCLNKKTK